MEAEQIKKRLAEIAKEEEELKSAKRAVKDQLENDLEYVQAREEAKRANLKKKQIKDGIMSSPENQKLAETIKNTGEDLLVLKDILSAELLDYHQKYKTEEIIGDDGQVHKFKIEVKLISERGFGNEKERG